MISDSNTSNFFCYTILPDNLRTQYRFLSIVALTENNLKYVVENKQTHQHFLLTVTAPTLKITAHSSHRILEKTEHYQFELTPFEENTKLDQSITRPFSFFFKLRYVCLLLCVFLLLFSFYRFYTLPSSKNTVLLSRTSIQLHTTLASPDFEPVSPSPNPDVSIVDMSGHGYRTMTLDSGIAAKNIKILFFNKNHLKAIPDFSRFTQLEEAYFHKNPISDLSNIQTCKKLKILILSETSIKQLSPLSKMKNLEILDLSNCRKIKHFQELQKLTRLRYLILTNTSISKKELAKLQKTLPGCIIYK